MNFAAVRNLNRIGLRNFRSFHRSINRAAEPPKEPCGCESAKPPDPPCPPKAPEPPPPPKVASSGPPPPPCPGIPQCPPTMCPPFLDPGNPCNYCPPPCIDPDYPDLRRLKAKQCKFQVDDDVPVFLKGGTVDVITFQVIVILVLSCVAYGIYVTVKPSFSNK